MSYDFVIDTYAWIEYFKGSAKGAIVGKLLESSNSATPSIAIAELSDVWCRENIKEWEKDIALIASKTPIIDLDSETAHDAGKIKNEIRARKKDFGLSDAIILATARKENAKVLSGDRHFEGLGNVEFLR